MRISDWSSDVCSSDLEQNRDGQLRSLLVNELGIDPARLVAVLHYDGTPITARFIAGAIGAHLGSAVQREKVARSEEHTSELQSLMRISYAVFCLKKKKQQHDKNSKCNDSTQRKNT